MSEAPVYRVDLDKNGDLDDLAISGEFIQMLRLERIDSDYMWGRIYLKDGNEIELSFGVSKKSLSVFIDAPAQPPGAASD